MAEVAEVSITNGDSVENLSHPEETEENGQSQFQSATEDASKLLAVEGKIAPIEVEAAVKPVEQEGMETADQGSEEAVKPVHDEVQEIVNEQELKYWNAVKENPSDFTTWTYLLQFVEQENKLTSARKAFDAFFKRYPYCYGYWKKYADMERKNGNIEEAKKVFESGVTAVSFSVDLWVHYLNFASQSSKGQADGPKLMRSLFERAVNTAGFEFRSDKLWDAYIEWEKSQGQLQRVTALYDKVMTVPTQMYSQHFEKFKEHINSNPIRETLSTEELLKLRAEVAAAPPGVTTETEPLVRVAASMSPPGVDEDSPSEGDDVAPGTETLVAPGEESSITIEKQDDAASIAIKEKVIAARAEVFAKLEDEVRKIWAFEEAIKRPYFHVKPLERVQLKNWREYLDFEISNGTHQRIVALFERCVIACALYEDFWQRFAQYMENHSIEGCRSVYERACTIHLLRKPNIHLAWAAFEEQHGNAVKASEILETLESAVPGLAMVKTRRTNLERRLGNNDKAAEIFETAIKEATDKDTGSFYSVRYSRYLAKVVRNAEKARTVITEAIEKDNLNKRLYLQLLDLELNALPVDEDRVEAVFDLVKNSNLPTEVKQGFSQRRLEMLEDFSSSIAKIMKAHEAHAKLYKVKTVAPAPSGKKRAQDEGSEHKAKAQKTEVATDANNVVSSVVGTEAYDATYPTAYSAAYSSYAAPAHTQNQWAAYNTAAQPAGYNYNQWYQQYGAAYGHAPSAATQ